MKRPKFLVLSAALLLTSCSGNTKTGDSDSSALTDSADIITSDSVSADSTTTNEPSEVVINDAICLDMKGNVKKLVETTEEGGYKSTTTYVFDNNGLLISMNGDPVKMKRDDTRRPIKVTYSEIDEDGDPQSSSVSFFYDEKNQLIREKHDTYQAGWSIVYKRDANGNVISEKISDDLGGGETISISYPDNSFDSSGNWTNRTTKSAGGTTKVTRKITYRQ